MAKNTKNQLTEFQRRVSAVVLGIPLGQTRSYKWVAERIGRPRAVRAVGQALRRNPFPLIIPCHRVIKGDGSFGGYAGGSGNRRFCGAKRKAELLAIERQIAENLRPFLLNSPSGRSKINTNC